MKIVGFMLQWSGLQLLIKKPVIDCVVVEVVHLLNRAYLMTSKHSIFLNDSAGGIVLFKIVWYILHFEINPNRYERIGIER